MIRVFSQHIFNPVARVTKGSLADEKAIKDAMAGVDAAVGLLGAPLSLSALIWRIKTTPTLVLHHLPSDESTEVKRILALSTPSYPVSSDILATRFHAAYLCATREMPRWTVSTFRI